MQLNIFTNITGKNEYGQDKILPVIFTFSYNDDGNGKNKFPFFFDKFLKCINSDILEQISNSNLKDNIYNYFNDNETVNKETIIKLPCEYIYIEKTVIYHNKKIQCMFELRENYLHDKSIF